MTAIGCVAAQPTAAASHTVGDDRTVFDDLGLVGMEPDEARATVEAAGGEFFSEDDPVRFVAVTVGHGRVTQFRIC